MSPSAARSSFAIEVPDSLLVRLRGGERAAFEQVYRWFERPVFTLALRVCGEREQAADVLQDTMLKVFHRIGDFRGTGGPRQEGTEASPFWGWLRQIAVNEALMSLRRNKRHDDILPLPDSHDTAGELIDERSPPPPAAADAATLQRALDRLPAVTRSVLWLYHAEGYTHEEIALLMARTPSFSKSQLSRGTKRLRELLEPAGGCALPASTREAAHG
ncbi:RNA polymerase sigma factor [Lysobacter brunescens]|uniref:RNA polymerase sigma factor n=1 Tax=Lysobacter brunescens TaxID=262323 RepID=A0ABW2YAU9_9GAMM